MWFTTANSDYSGLVFLILWSLKIVKIGEKNIPSEPIIRSRKYGTIQSVANNNTTPVINIIDKIDAIIIVIFNGNTFL